jgi:mannose-6-phosphate isomerase-like protein (cupin superfamily)
MFRSAKLSRLLLAGAAVGVLLAATSAAHAGECPEGKMGANPLANAMTEPAGVTDEVLSAIDLSKEAVKLNDRMFRLRRLEVQPGGVVPLHSHADRPALIYVVSGGIAPPTDARHGRLHEGGVCVRPLRPRRSRPLSPKTRD